MPVTDETKKEIVKIISKVFVKSTPPMVIASQSEKGMQLIGDKEVPYGSTKKMVPGMFFVSVITAKTMVSFHFFPMYMNEKPFISLAPNSMKYLKGKTCFNYTKPEQVDAKEIEALMKKGVEIWKKMGYMK